jgi:tetratricopeptide (TPR) repeat protein
MESEYFKIAVGLFETGKYEKAINFFTKAIEQTNKVSEAYNLRGASKFMLHDVEGALSDISKALQIDNQNHEAWFNKGDILSRIKKYEEAEFFLKTANEIFPGSFIYLKTLIRVSFAQKKYEQCINYCDEILEQKAYDYVALFYHGLCLARELKYVAAIYDYQKLVKNGKGDESVYCSLGFWYSKIGELKKAYNNLHLSLDFNPTHPYSLNNLGHVFYLQGDYKKALELANQSLEIDPSNSYAYKNRALIFLKTGEKEKAHKDLIKAKELGYAEDHDDEVDKVLEKHF